MCKVLRNPKNVTIHMNGNEIHGKIRGTANLEVCFRGNEIVAYSEEGFTKQQLATLAISGAYPGTTLDTPVIVADNGNTYYGFQVNYTED